MDQTSLLGPKCAYFSASWNSHCRSTLAKCPFHSCSGLLTALVLASWTTVHTAAFSESLRKTQVSFLCPAQNLSILCQIKPQLLGLSSNALHALPPNCLFGLSSHDQSTLLFRSNWTIPSHWYFCYEFIHKKAP